MKANVTGTNARPIVLMCVGLAALTAIAVVAIVGIKSILGSAAAAACAYPPDARAYSRDCESWSNSKVTTLDGALQYYKIPMPADATAVRFYIDGGGFNGGGGFYLKFTAPAAQMKTFLTAMNTPKNTAVDAESIWQQQYDDAGQPPVPWNFTAADVVYRPTDPRTATNAATTIVDNDGGPAPTAYLFVGD